MYYEVSPQHIYSDRMNVGEVEVLDAVDVVLDSPEVAILDSPNVVILDSPEIPTRRHLDGVRRHLFLFVMIYNNRPFSGPQIFQTFE